MTAILASVGPVTHAGTLAQLRRRPWLMAQSGWFPVKDELNIGGDLLLAVAEDNTLCSLELMVHSRHWAGEKLTELFPDDAIPGSLVFASGSVATRFFNDPVSIIAADAKTRVRIVIRDEPASKLVALSKDCVARLAGGRLLGFDLRRFTPK